MRPNDSTGVEASALDGESYTRGTLAGFAAYALWGFLVLFWPLLLPAGPFEILAHRIVWSLVFVVAILLLQRRSWGWLRRLWTDYRSLTLLASASLLIGSNWGVYIWAVNEGHVIDASLGYYVTPLASVALGAIVLRERIGWTRGTAICFAGFGVVWLFVVYGQPPWAALLLAGTFSIYGLVKKKVSVSPLQGLMVESLFLSLPALVFLVYLGFAGQGEFGGDLGSTILLVGSGVATTVPLLLFAIAAGSSMPLNVLGLLQYVTPTVQFFLGIFIFKEVVDVYRLAGFIFVWIGLSFLLASMLMERRRMTA